MSDSASSSSVLITGAAGYIGTHLQAALRTRGLRVIGVDSMTRPLHPVADGIVQIDVRDTAALEAVLRRESVTSVIHLAAQTFPAESLLDPFSYYSINVTGTLSVLTAMRAANVSRFVFASSCAIYGSTTETQVTESSNPAPCSPYGRSKLIAEQLIADCVAAWPMLEAILLRLFNVAGGCSGQWAPGKLCAGARLIPAAVRATRDPTAVLGINGNNWPTPDGTCVRDYIHVEDVCEAMALSLSALKPGSSPVLNIGSGIGSSIRTVLRAAETATGGRIATQLRDPSPGDPAFIVANITAARELLSWCPAHSAITEIVQSAVTGSSL